jgi:hypothetical protein
MKQLIAHSVFGLVACYSMIGRADDPQTTQRADRPPVAPANAPHKNYVKKRLFVLTDIGADPDDSMSLVRLLTYSDDIDIEGLVATTSAFQKTRVEPEALHEIIHAYGKVQPNLLLHDADYPAEEHLQARVGSGLPLYGMSGVGEGHDSAGSEALIRALEKPDARPLWVAIWGGPNVLAQALWKIRKTRSAKDAAALYAKLRIHAISDQDDSGPWIRGNFPTLFYIVSPGSWVKATWRAMTQVFPGSDGEVISDAWLAKNIQQGHGPLGAQYPDVAYGMEGDSPSFLGLIPNGLNDMEHPNWGSWGGRYEFYTPPAPTPGPEASFGLAFPGPETHPIWTNAQDSYPPPFLGYHRDRAPAMTVKDNFVTLWRWRTEFQNDFAARIAWTTKSYAEANHPPVPVIAGPPEFTVKSGDTFDLVAGGSYDPDGDSLSYFWFQYVEAGTYDKPLSFGNLAQNLHNVYSIAAPGVDHAVTIHFILKLTDKGSPPLTRYQRVIVTVVPK